MTRPKLLKHIPGHKYRICRKCDYEYNVSLFDDHGKIYYCQYCEPKKRRKTTNERENYHHRRNAR